jgi:hypothetical protein
MRGEPEKGRRVKTASHYLLTKSTLTPVYYYIEFLIVNIACFPYFYLSVKMLAFNTFKLELHLFQVA